jgi:hypothetical protein
LFKRTPKNKSYTGVTYFVGRDENSSVIGINAHVARACHGEGNDG